MQETTSSSTDPFNWPFPTRQDLMSLSTLQKNRDLVRVKTAVATSRVRQKSQNLDAHDIDGKLTI